MKVLLSSGKLKAHLDSLDAERITKVIFNSDGEMELHSNEKEISFCVDFADDEMKRKLSNNNADKVVNIYRQISNRWDWLYDLLSKIEEQPIVLDIESDKLHIIFQY